VHSIELKRPNNESDLDYDLDASVQDAHSDPFGERFTCAFSMCKQILGGRFRFESNSEALLHLVEAAYGGLPSHELPIVAPEFRIELRLLPRQAEPGMIEPPPVRMQSGAGLLCGVMDASNYVVLAPERHRALVVASEDMLSHPYHLRYELIEFATFMVQPASMLATGVANYLHVKEDALRFVDDDAIRRWIIQSPVIRRRSGVSKFEPDLRKGHGRLAAKPFELVGAVFMSSEPADDHNTLLSVVPDGDIAARLSVDQPYAAGQPGWQRFVQQLAQLGAHQLHRGSHPRDSVHALQQLLR
jgi:hypothetical protein